MAKKLCERLVDCHSLFMLIGEGYVLLLLMLVPYMHIRKRPKLDNLIRMGNTQSNQRLKYAEKIKVRRICVLTTQGFRIFNVIRVLNGC